ncbi:MAG TPA: hypothetical protein VN207_12530 [Ktedonobacteraceae bacterium]|nr:hypothetical protein [Ktedonobacteraceae bacterium]
MTYDHAKTKQLLEIVQTRDLTKSERAMAREQIELYYAKKLASLQRNLFEALVRHDTGELDPFEVDEYIHHYHKQSQELYSYMNSQSQSNDRLPIWLAVIDADEQGIRVWQPATKLPHEEKQSDES